MRPGPRMSPALPASGRRGRGRRRARAEAARMLALRDWLGNRPARRSRPRRSFSAPRPSGCPIRHCSRCHGMKAETAVIAFDLEGIAVSSGAACSSGKVQPSHVLAAMGVCRALARGAVRVSLGWSTTEADVESFLGAWRKLASALSKGTAQALPPNWLHERAIYRRFEWSNAAMGRPEAGHRP